MRETSIFIVFLIFSSFVHVESFSKSDCSKTDLKVKVSLEFRLKSDGPPSEEECTSGKTGTQVRALPEKSFSCDVATDFERGWDLEYYSPNASLNTVVPSSYHFQLYTNLTSMTLILSNGALYNGTCDFVLNDGVCVWCFGSVGCTDTACTYGLTFSVYEPFWQSFTGIIAIACLVAACFIISVAIAIACYCCCKGRDDYDDDDRKRRRRKRNSSRNIESVKKSADIPTKLMESQNQKTRNMDSMKSKQREADKDSIRPAKSVPMKTFTDSTNEKASTSAQIIPLATSRGVPHTTTQVEQPPSNYSPLPVKTNLMGSTQGTTYAPLPAQNSKGTLSGSIDLTKSNKNTAKNIEAPYIQFNQPGNKNSIKGMDPRTVAIHNPNYHNTQDLKSYIEMPSKNTLLSSVAIPSSQQSIEANRYVAIPNEYGSSIDGRNDFTPVFKDQVIPSQPQSHYGSVNVPSSKEYGSSIPVMAKNYVPIVNTNENEYGEMPTPQQIQNLEQSDYGTMPTHNSSESYPTSHLRPGYGQIDPDEDDYGAMPGSSNNSPTLGQNQNYGQMPHRS